MINNIFSAILALKNERRKDVFKVTPNNTTNYLRRIHNLRMFALVHILNNFLFTCKNHSLIFKIQRNWIFIAKYKPFLVWQMQITLITEGKYT